MTARRSQPSRKWSRRSPMMWRLLPSSDGRRSTDQTSCPFAAKARRTTPEVSQPTRMFTPPPAQESARAPASRFRSGPMSEAGAPRPLPAPRAETDEASAQAIPCALSAAMAAWHSRAPGASALSPIKIGQGPIKGGKLGDRVLNALAQGEGAHLGLRDLAIVLQRLPQALHDATDILRDLGYVPIPATLAGIPMGAAARAHDRRALPARASRAGRRRRPRGLPPRPQARRRSLSRARTWRASESRCA